MEFYENRAKKPFYVFVQIGRWLQHEWKIYQTRRVLDKLSDAQLKDIGLRRDDYC